MSGGVSPDQPVEAPARADAPAATYERDLPVSLERIWENVLDWEHLPYLHSQSFTSVSMHSSDADGWHGEIGIPGIDGKAAEIDVRIDRANLRYTTRTVAGVGAGTSIVTTLSPRDERATSIRVEFHLPWVPAEARASVGEYYRTLYVELWDQDEAMMLERQRVLDGVRTRASGDGEALAIGRVRELGARLPLDVELGGRRFRVVRVDGRLFAYDTRCPHLGGPLPCDEKGQATCPWHGYSFDVRTGRSTDGRSLRLGRAAVVEIDACDGEVMLRLPDARTGRNGA